MLGWPISKAVLLLISRLQRRRRVCVLATAGGRPARPARAAAAAGLSELEAWRLITLGRAHPPHECSKERKLEN